MAIAFRSADVDFQSPLTLEMQLGSITADFFLKRPITTLTILRPDYHYSKRPIPVLMGP